MEMHIRSVEKAMTELVFSADHSAKHGKAVS
jgi:hypothetical protein